MSDEVTFPAHDCRAWNTEHSHNQDDATWTTCGLCGRITTFQWKNQERATQARITKELDALEIQARSLLDEARRIIREQAEELATLRGKP